MFRKQRSIDFLHIMIYAPKGVIRLFVGHDIPCPHESRPSTLSMFILRLSLKLAQVEYTKWVKAPYKRRA